MEQAKAYAGIKWAEDALIMRQDFALLDPKASLENDAKCEGAPIDATEMH